jgi:hypothetical protein
MTFPTSYQIHYSQSPRCTSFSLTSTKPLMKVSEIIERTNQTEDKYKITFESKHYAMKIYRVIVVKVEQFCAKAQC